MKNNSRVYFKELFKAFSAALLIFVFINTVLITTQLLPGRILDGSWHVILPNGNEKEIRLPFQEYVDKPESFIFKKDLYIDDSDMIVLLRPVAHAFRLSINDQFIYGIGDLNDPSSSVWNTAHPIPIPDKFKNSNATLKIELADSFLIGIRANVFVGKSSELLNAVSLVNWFMNNFLLMCCGAAFVIGVILISLGRISCRSLNYNVYMGLAAILVALYGIDYTFYWSLIDSDILLLMKRIAVSVGVLGSLSFIAGLENFFLKQIRITLYLSIPTVLCILFLLLAQPASLVWKMMPVINALVFINFSILVTIVITSKKTEKVGFLIPAFLLMFSLLETLIVILFNLNMPFVLQYIVLAAGIIFGVRLISEYNMLFIDREKLQLECVSDPLTDVYNRRLLAKLNPTGSDTVVMMDLDNFKFINDNEGHKRGDEILKILSDILKSSFRREDVIVRLGGDEFLIIIRFTHVTTAKNILTRIEGKFKTAIGNSNTGISYGICQFKDSIEQSIKEAYKLMYDCKTAKKGQ